MTSSFLLALRSTALLTGTFSPTGAKSACEQERATSGLSVSLPLRAFRIRAGANFRVAGWLSSNEIHRVRASFDSSVFYPPLLRLDVDS